MKPEEVEAFIGEAKRLHESGEKPVFVFRYTPAQMANMGRLMDAAYFDNLFMHATEAESVEIEGGPTYFARSFKGARA